MLNCSCWRGSSPRPPISACYTCTRVVNHHRQLHSQLQKIDQLLDTSTTHRPPLIHTGDFEYAAAMSEETAARREAGLSLLQRFLLHSKDEEPSILALGPGTGALNISAAENYEGKTKVRSTRPAPKCSGN